MAWSLTDAAKTFRMNRDAWDELNASGDNHVLLDADFVQALLDRFSERTVLLAQYRSPSSPAMMLLVHLGLGRWQTFQPAQQPIGHTLFTDLARAEEQVSELMRDLPGYALVIGMTRQDPDRRGFIAPPNAAHIEVIDYVETGRVELSESFEDYWSRRPAEMREGNSRRRRRLDRQGVDVKFRATRDPDQIDAGLRDYCRLEESGWKSSAGTAVGMRNEQGKFYSEALQRLCQRGEGVIYELLFNGAPVASQICVERGHMSVSLKIAYDESYRRDAPGYLLQEEIIRHIVKDRPAKTIEFYGPATDGWTRKWTGDIRTMYHVNQYRSGALRNGLRLVKALRRPQRSDPVPATTAA